MTALVTGLRGTVGRALGHHLTQRGEKVVGWDRSVATVNDYDAMDAYVGRVAPSVIYHLAIASSPTGLENEGWLVNIHWPNELAWIARQRRIPFVFTSTAMVFSDAAKGPFTTSSAPDASEGYGLEKLRAEDRVRAQNPDARIVRIGWQIGEAAGSNNMIDFMESGMKRDGHIRASRKWLPATSFLSDTAAALRAVLDLPPGLYHADSNRKWNFAQIARALSRRHGSKWKIEETEDFVYDQRLLDDRLKLPDLEESLPELLAD